MKHCPIQARALSPGMVIHTGAYVCISAVEVLGDIPALPYLRIHCLPIPGEAAPTPAQCVLELRSDAWVSHFPMFKLERSGRRRVIPVLHLVSCVSTKLDRKSPAEELYCSTWFRLARAAVTGEPWVILSARHGVVRPRQRLAPYNESLIEKSRQERVAWAGRVLEQMPRADHYVLWAGSRYAEHLAGPLHAELPLRGLGIGQQLALLKQRAAQRAVRCPKLQPLCHASLMALCRSP